MDRNLARRELEQILIPAAGEEAGLEAGFMLEQVLGRRTSRPVTAEDWMQLSAWYGGGLRENRSSIFWENGRLWGCPCGWALAR